MLSDIVVGRAQQRLDHIDLHRHAQLSCKPWRISQIYRSITHLFRTKR